MSDAALPFVPLLDSRPDDEPWEPLSWPPPEGTVLSGDVVDVTRLDPDDGASVGALFSALDHDDVWRHVAGRPGSADAYAESIRTVVAEGRQPWLVRLRHDYAGLSAGDVVGTSSYLDVSVPDARLEIGSTAYTPAVWGTAVNPEVKLLLLGQAFDVLGAGRVQLKTDVRNERSQRALAVLGATYEGTLRRYQRRHDGTIRDTVMFSVIAEDWPRVRDGLRDRLATFPHPEG